jgi:hypothetical protein
MQINEEQIVPISYVKLKTKKDTFAVLVFLIVSNDKDK